MVPENVGCNGRGGSNVRLGAGVLIGCSGTVSSGGGLVTGVLIGCNVPVSPSVELVAWVLTWKAVALKLLGAVGSAVDDDTRESPVAPLAI